MIRTAPAASATAPRVTTSLPIAVPVPRAGTSRPGHLEHLVHVSTIVAHRDAVAITVALAWQSGSRDRDAETRLAELDTELTRLQRRLAA